MSTRPRTQAECFPGWRPYRTTQPTTMHAGPGFDYPVVAKLTRHAGLGLVSTPNPHADPHPPARLAEVDEHGQRWRWCAKRAGKNTAGWVLEDHIEHHKASTPYDGPAGEDFEVGRGSPPEKKKRTKPYRKHPGRYEVIAEQLYGRLAPHGTAYCYLLKGDHVRATHINDTGEDVWVEITDSETCGPGTWMWAQLSYLKRLGA